MSHVRFLLPFARRVSRDAMPNPEVSPAAVYTFKKQQQQNKNHTRQTGTPLSA